jgi:hypothetical protein
MLITKVPEIHMKNHARRRGHHVQMLEVGPAKMAHCLECGGQWFNMEAVAEANVNTFLESTLRGREVGDD